MKETAIILADSNSSVSDNNITNLLEFFGVKSSISTIPEFSAGYHSSDDGSRTLRVFCSSDTFSKLIDELDRNPSAIRLWGKYVHSAFVYGGDSTLSHKLARRIMRSEDVPIIQIDRRLSEWIVSDKVPQLCGVMSGLRIPIGKGAVETGIVCDGDTEKAPDVIFGEHSSVFLTANYELVPLFLSTASKIIDIDAELVARNFDIRDHLLSALPIVMYVRWAFAEVCWASPENNACVVLDDPLLRPQYGFLNYQNLLDVMGRHNFTTSIAFIPWNWRRSDFTVANMFKSHPERYSLSIHGCDHTGGEFGSQNVDSLVWKSQQAIDRMSRHEARTGIAYDRIMVFPQGVFTGTSMEVLKHAQFIGAVNTEVLTTDLRRPPINISDVWDVAVMRYSSFPIYTRRYPSQGVENFAFDMLLGKPCIVVVHHDYCRNHNAHLVEFIDRLNALNCRLSWRSLGEVVRRSCRQREVSPGIVEVEMYGSELRLENRSERKKRFLITKRESDAPGVKEIRASSQQIPWHYSECRISFEIELPAGHSTMVCIIFHDYPAQVRYREKTRYKLKVMLRRYLSEVRDNYVMTKRTWSS